MLRRDIVAAHALPTAGMPVHEGDSGARGQLLEDTLEVGAVEGHIALQDAIDVARPGDLTENGRVAGRPDAREPIGEGEVLLPAGLVEVKAEVPVESRPSSRPRTRRARGSPRRRSCQLSEHREDVDPQRPGVAGRSNRRLRYCQSGPMPLAWADCDPIGTRAGRTWIAAGGMNGTAAECWIATSQVAARWGPVGTRTVRMTLYGWLSTPVRDSTLKPSPVTYASRSSMVTAATRSASARGMSR